MAVLTETGANVSIQLVRGTEDKVFLVAQTHDGEGNVLRSFTDTDVTTLMPQNLVEAATLLLDAAETYIKTVYEIP